MRDHTYSPFFIISAELSKEDVLINSIATSNLESDLKNSGHKFSEIVGCYKGKLEASFIVYTSDTGLGIELCKRYNQDSVLLRNSHNDCVLWYSEEKQEFKGHFKQVPEKEALKHDAYSIINGDFYIITEER